MRLIPRYDAIYLIKFSQNSVKIRNDVNRDSWYIYFVDDTVGNE